MTGKCYTTELFPYQKRKIQLMPFDFVSIFVVVVSVEANEWNKNNDHIGTASKLPDGVNAEDFIGAEKEKSESSQLPENLSFNHVQLAQPISVLLLNYV